MILHLPPVPEAVSPSLTGFEIKSMTEHSKQTSIELKLPAKKRKSDDYALMPKKTRAKMIKYPELRLSRNFDAKINTSRSSGALGAQEPDLLTHIDTGACQNVKKNWRSRVQATPPASDVVEIMENPHDTSRMSGICLNDSPPAVCLTRPSSRQIIILSSTSSHMYTRRDNRLRPTLYGHCRSLKTRPKELQFPPLLGIFSAELLNPSWENHMHHRQLPTTPRDLTFTTDSHQNIPTNPREAFPLVEMNMMKIKMVKDLRPQVRQPSSNSGSFQAKGVVQLRDAWLSVNLLMAVTFQLLSGFWGIVWVVVQSSPRQVT